MNKLGKLLAIILVAVSVVSCGKKKIEDVNKAKIQYKHVSLADANKGEFEKVSVSSGTLDSMNEINETVKYEVNILKINYKNGDKVNVGDIIVVLESQSIKSAYLESKAKFISAKADYEKQKITFKKYKTLYSEELISEEEFLNIKTKLSSSEGMYKSAEAGYLKNKKDFDDLTVRAKIKGTVANLDLKLYQKIEKGKQIFTVVDNENLRILSGVASSDIITLKRGAKANVFVEETPTPIDGIVYEINPVANPTTRKFEVKIKISNNDEQYKQGMFAKVELQTGKKIGIMVPKKALIVENLSNYIFIVKKESVEFGEGDKKEVKEVLVAYKIKVKLGASSGENQEVISEELEDKNKVVVAGQYSLSDGDYIIEK